MDKGRLNKSETGKKLGIGRILTMLRPGHNSDKKHQVVESEFKAPEWSDRDVLVGVLRNKQQLDICLDNKFYHIPARYISSRHLPIKYVAIYQSKNLFGKEAGIRYFGEVEECTCVKRRLIRQIPKNSNESYYLFRVKSWKLLEHPIEAKEVGFVRIFTNSEMMFASREVPELMLSDKKEHMFYNCIKDAIRMAQTDKEGKTAVFAWEDYGFAVDVDDIQLIRNGQLINIYSVYDFMDIPLTILGQMRRDMDRFL